MDMISINLNGERREIPAAASVVDMLELTGAGRQQVAVVVNERIVRPDERATTILRENDQVDVLVFAGGG
jgi:sulfur carrier protein